MKIFSGNSNLLLSQEVCTNLGCNLGKAVVSKFSDGEISVSIEENVRGKDIYIIQSLCSPVNDNLMELLLLVDAMKRASAKSITAVVPYYGYARQDRRSYSARVPISAKVIADLLQNVGTQKLLTVDLHADQIQGFFKIPVDNVFALTSIYDNILPLVDGEKLVIVSPDIGGVTRARAIAATFNCELVIIDKRRPIANVSEVINIIGDVNNCICLLVDDMCDTAGTLCLAAQRLLEEGAKKVIASVVHPVLSGSAISRLANSNISNFITTNTIPLSEDAKKLKIIKQVSIAKLLSKSINCIQNKESFSALFPNKKKIFNN